MGTLSIAKGIDDLSLGEKQSLYLSEFLPEFWEIPKPVEAWIEDPYYVPNPHLIWPEVKKKIIEIGQGDYDEVILIEGIGGGKSFTAALLMLRMVYELACLKKPQVYHQISPSSMIAFVNNSDTSFQAKKVVFEEMLSFFNDSPWFQKHLRPDPKVRSEIRFMRPISAEEYDDLRGRAVDTRKIGNSYWVKAKICVYPGICPTGYNLFGGIMDEFFGRERVSESRKGIEKREYDEAEFTHSQMMKRMRSRFVRKGGALPGMLVMIGSPRYPDDYGEKKFLDSKRKGSRIYGRRGPTWATQPESRFSGNIFIVDLKEGRGAIRRDTSGNILIRPRSAHFFSQMSDMIKQAFIEVPMEYLNDAQEDINVFLRDMATIPSTAIRPFYADFSLAKAAVEKGKKLGMVNPFHSQYYQNPDLRWDPDWKPDQNYARFVHVDLALAHDAVGIAGVYVDKFVGVSGRDDTKAHVVVDFMGRILADASGYIKFDDVLDVLYDYADRVGYIALITYDRFQSIGSIQTLAGAGYIAANLSIDRTTHLIKLDARDEMGYSRVSTEGKYVAAQEALKSAVEDRRIIIPDWKFWLDGEHYFLREAQGAEYNEIKNKVDHRPRGSIDVLQAMAGAVFNAENNTYEMDFVGVRDSMADRLASLEEDKFSDFYEVIEDMSESEDSF